MLDLDEDSASLLLEEEVMPLALQAQCSGSSMGTIEGGVTRINASEVDTDRRSGT